MTDDTIPQSAPEQQAAKKGTKKAAKKKSKATKKVAKKAAGKKRTVRPFPASSLEDAMELALAIQEHVGGQRVRKTTLFEKLDRPADGSLTRQLITNSGRYGLTTGGYQAEFLELTDDGNLATSDEADPRAQLAARFKLGIEQIEPFNRLYEETKDKKLPGKEFLVDILKDAGVAGEHVEEAVDTFIVNAKFLGLLRTIGGSERLVAIGHVLDEQQSRESLGGGHQEQHAHRGGDQRGKSNDSAVTQPSDLKTICFYITPIGEEGSEQRKHSDFLLEHIVRPAVEKEFKLAVVRADQIGKAGMIGKQVLEHILHARLVIADLSFHNPNVFYELCLRHVSRLPTVQVIRSVDDIPFDLEQYRTIRIDTSDVYGLYPKLQTHQSEIANQVRRALEDGDAADNPISVYYPRAELTWAKERK